MPVLKKLLEALADQISKDWDSEIESQLDSPVEKENNDAEGAEV